MLISEAQERGEIHKLLPQTHSIGVDYSLFIMETVETLLGEMETTSAALRQSFPPPICMSRSLFRGFSVYGRLHAIYVGGAIFIVGFRSRWSRGRKDRRQQSHEAPEGGPHGAKESGRVDHPLLGLRPPLICFLRSQVLFLHKTDARKFSGHLDGVWVPETSKYRK